MALPQLRIRSVAYRDRETQERGSLHHVLLCLFRMFRDVSEPRPMERLGERCAEHRNADRHLAAGATQMTIRFYGN